MHETSLVRLPHLHSTQEDNGEGKRVSDKELGTSQI